MIKVVISMQNKNFQYKKYINLFFFNKPFKFITQKVMIYQKVKLRTCILFYIIIHNLLTKDAN